MVAAAQMPRRPNLFVVGAPKCATTSLAAYLDQHPQVYVSPQKEPLHFCSERHLEWWKITDRDAYMRLFAGATDQPVLAEASVWYLLDETAPAKIRDFSPDARIIVMLRNPVDLVTSLHAQFLFSGNETIRDFRKAYAAQADRRRGRRIPSRAHFPDGLQYTEVARFAPQVARLFAAFPRERVKVVLFEDFVADKAGAYREILEFIGVDPEIAPDFAIHNSRKRLRSIWLQRRLLKTPEIWRAERWLPVPALRDALGWRLPVWRERLLAWNTAPDPNPWRLTPGDRATLHGDFADDIAALERLLGRSLDLWRRKNLGPAAETEPSTAAARLPETV